MKYQLFMYYREHFVYFNDKDEIVHNPAKKYIFLHKRFIYDDNLIKVIDTAIDYLN